LLPKQPIDEQVISEYLLGGLPQEDAERLDEMTVADEDFAEQVRAVENDLVDAYVRKELSADLLSKFEAHYLASPKRREKVKFAETFDLYRRHLASRQVKTDHAKWKIAAVAAVLLLSLGGYLLVENMTSVVQRDSKVISFSLAAPARGVQKLATLIIPSETASISLNLEADPNDFVIYVAMLKDPVSNQIIWRSGKLTADRRGNSIQTAIPASLLQSQNYLIDLFGIDENGSEEMIGTYPFKIVKK
jgi:anti-sigma-K factor RskA